MGKEITEEQIKKIKSIYNDNREELSQVRNTIKENGILNNGLSESDESWEQGFNNGIENICSILGINLY